RLDHFPDYALRPKLEGALQGFVGRFLTGQTPHEPQLRAACLRDGAANVQDIGLLGQTAFLAVMQQLLHAAGVGGSQDALAWSCACCCDERRRRALAQAQTWTPAPGRPCGAQIPLQFAAQSLGAASHASDVVADVRNHQWPWLEREHPVE